MGLFGELLPPRAHVTVDDGGVRCLAARRATYVPFVALAEARVVRRLGWTMRLALRDGTTRAFRLAPADVLEVQREVLTGLGASPRAPAIDVDRFAAFARRGRPLVEWLASAVVGAGSGYRDTALDVAAAGACLRDAAAPADLRAACAHALLETTDEEALTIVASVFVAHSPPPIVVVATRVGHAGAALVPNGMCDDALPFLSPADADAARAAMRSPATRTDAAHAHAVMLRLRDEALRKVEAETAHALRRYRARPIGGYASEQGVTRFK